LSEENRYYSEKLSAMRLKRCYEIASLRIKQYLEAEIQYVLEYIKPSDVVLELGCGYGRILSRLAQRAKKVYGIDISEESLRLAREIFNDMPNVELHKMNAKSLSFKDHLFDVVIAIQNSISAFKLDPCELIKESLRVTKHGGKIILSSYSKNIWEARLDWFIQQSKEGLIGEIDLKNTRHGEIVCKDGFKATTFTPVEFLNLTSEMKLEAIIEEVDKSSIFFVITAYH